jgi:hypothetical protein
MQLRIDHGSGRRREEGGTQASQGRIIGRGLCKDAETSGRQHGPEGGAGLVPPLLGKSTCGRRLPFVAAHPLPASRQRGVGQARRCIAGLSVHLGEVSALCR